MFHKRWPSFQEEKARGSVRRAQPWRMVGCRESCTDALHPANVSRMNPTQPPPQPGLLLVQWTSCQRCGKSAKARDGVQGGCSVSEAESRVQLRVGREPGGRSRSSGITQSDIYRALPRSARSLEKACQLDSSHRRTSGSCCSWSHISSPKREWSISGNPGFPILGTPAERRRSWAI